MSNLNSLKKSQLIDLVAQLERNAEDDRRRIGVMMYEANQLQHRVNELEAEVEILKESYDEVEAQLIAPEAQVKRQGMVIAAQPKAAPKPQPAPAEVESESPVIQITDSDRAVWAKFQALSREQRMVIINWARPQFSHVGINNIIQVRAAWHEFNNPSSCADESVLADIA